jgi:hypothetical protein
MATAITGTMANLARVTIVSKEAMVTLRMAATMVAQVMAGAALAKGVAMAKAAATVARVTAEDMAPVTAGAAMVGRGLASAEANTVVGEKEARSDAGFLHQRP